MTGPRMTQEDFRRLSEFIESELGIKMPPAKKTMLETRLQKRLRALGMGAFKDYCDYVLESGASNSELVHFIDLVTTNKTDFFREPDHFDYLIRSALPELARTSGAGVKRPLVAWSAGCSTGEEPYTMAMTMNEFASRYPGLGFDFSIIATDISTRVLQMASRGIYNEDRITPIPEALKKNYLMRSRDRSKGLVRVIPELRSLVRFRRLNFMDEDFGFREPLDMIFCRNVVIYFEKDTQEKLFAKFAGCLRPGSYLFIGHSESLNGMDLPFVKVAPSVFRKIE